MDAYEFNEYLDLLERNVVDELPTPGSKDRNNPEIYAGKAVRVKSVLHDFFDSRGRGLECLHHLEGSNKARSQDPAEHPYGGMSEEGLKRNHAKWRQRQSRGRAIVQRGCLDQRLHASHRGRVSRYRP